VTTFLKLRSVSGEDQLDGLREDIVIALAPDGFAGLLLGGILHNVGAVLLSRYVHDAGE